GFHKFLRASIRGEPITMYGDGEQTRDFTFVGDAVSATVAAATRGVPGRVYNIGGGSRVSINQVLAMIGRVSGRRPHITVDSPQKGDMRHTFADTSLARADLGFRPTVELEAGLAAEYRWLTEVLQALCRSCVRVPAPHASSARHFFSRRLVRVRRIRAASSRPARRSPTGSCSSGAPPR